MYQRRIMMKKQIGPIQPQRRFVTRSLQPPLPGPKSSPSKHLPPPTLEPPAEPQPAGASSRNQQINTVLRMHHHQWLYKHSNRPRVIRTIPKESSSSRPKKRRPPTSPLTRARKKPVPPEKTAFIQDTTQATSTITINVPPPQQEETEKTDGNDPFIMTCSPDDIPIVVGRMESTLQNGPGYQSFHEACMKLARQAPLKRKRGRPSKGSTKREETEGFLTRQNVVRRIHQHMGVARRFLKRVSVIPSDGTTTITTSKDGRGKLSCNTRTMKWIHITDPDQIAEFCFTRVQRLRSMIRSSDKDGCNTDHAGKTQFHHDHGTQNVASVKPGDASKKHPSDTIFKHDQGHDTDSTHNDDSDDSDYEPHAPVASPARPSPNRKIQVQNHPAPPETCKMDKPVSVRIPATLFQARDSYKLLVFGSHNRYGYKVDPRSHLTAILDTTVLLPSRCDLAWCRGLVEEQVSRRCWDLPQGREEWNFLVSKKSPPQPGIGGGAKDVIPQADEHLWTLAGYLEASALAIPTIYVLAVNPRPPLYIMV